MKHRVEHLYENARGVFLSFVQKNKRYLIKEREAGKINDTIYAFKKEAIETQETFEFEATEAVQTLLDEVEFHRNEYKKFEKAVKDFQENQPQEFKTDWNTIDQLQKKRYAFNPFDERTKEDIRLRSKIQAEIDFPNLFQTDYLN